MIRLIGGLVIFIAGLVFIFLAFSNHPSPLFSQLGLWCTAGGGAVTVAMLIRLTRLVV